MVWTRHWKEVRMQTTRERAIDMAGLKEGQSIGNLSFWALTREGASSQG